MKCAATTPRLPVSRFFLPVFFLLFSFPPAANALTASPPGMVYVPEGYFQMGTNSGNSGDEKPLHFVYTSAYFIDKYEVSNAQYKEFLTATGHPPPKYWDDERFNGPDLPVVGVSWHDAMAYARWKGRRLPTETEWEKAARGKDGRLYPWGNKWDKSSLSLFLNIFYRNNGRRYTAPVKSHESGASPFGALNMAGNVAEWCMDWYDPDYYRHSSEINPEGPAEPASMKVLRGGSWANDIESVQTVKRFRNYPYAKNNLYGFRTVLPAR